MRVTSTTTIASDQARTIYGFLAIHDAVGLSEYEMNLGDISVGKVLRYKDAPHVVVAASHTKMGRGGAVVKTKLKNVVTGAALDASFKEGDIPEEADVSRRKATFLYADENEAAFMDTENFDQFALATDDVSDQAKFLKEGQEVDVLAFEEKPVGIQLPKKVELQVSETPEGVRGDTAQGSVTKEATLENGTVVKVPLFIKKGDTIKVNTETGLYVERA